MGSKVKAGKVNALLNKWASVRQQQQEEEEQQQRLLEQESDPEWLEAKRQRELEQWSKQQMAAGAEDNPNFTPVMGDWRAKLGLSDGGAAAAAAGGGGTTETPEERAARKAAKKAAKAAKKAAAAAAGAGGAAASDGAGGSNSSASAWPTSMKTKPDLAALSVGLPAGWVAMYDLDQKTGVYSIYYGNPDTKASAPSCRSSCLCCCGCCCCASARQCGARIGGQGAYIEHGRRVVKRCALLHPHWARRASQFHVCLSPVRVLLDMRRTRACVHLVAMDPDGPASGYQCKWPTSATTLQRMHLGASFSHSCVSCQHVGKMSATTQSHHQQLVASLALFAQQACWCCFGLLRPVDRQQQVQRPVQVVRHRQAGRQGTLCPVAAC